jgi:chlorite dismutase
LQTGPVAWTLRAMTAPSTPKEPGLPEIDVREWGGKRDGERQVLDRRIFFQLLAFDVVHGATKATLDALASRLREAGVASVLYQDANAPTGIAILSWSEDPVTFVDRVLPLLDRPELVQRREYTMMGRTYSLGHEPDLEHALLRRPVEYCLLPDWNWHIWYPLRRSGAFEKLDKHEQSMILREHAAIGMAYGRAGLAHDVRLACHGLDAKDNEFVVGLIGKDLYPLSHVVQAMRHTKQTSEFISQMGPFFVGRVVARCAG